jgi:DnaJ-domain-containing protein 1
MGIFDRLGSVLKGYLAGEGGHVFRSHPQTAGAGDPDFQAAWEELDDFLEGRGGRGKPEKTPSGNVENRAWPAPEELRRDFAELGVPFAAPIQECRAAWKKLLKLHHPDRHAGHPDNLKTATEKSARINAARERIEKAYHDSGER